MSKAAVSGAVTPMGRVAQVNLALEVEIGDGTPPYHGNSGVISTPIIDMYSQQLIQCMWISKWML